MTREIRKEQANEMKKKKREKERDKNKKVLRSARWLVEHDKSLILKTN